MSFTLNFKVVGSVYAMKENNAKVVEFATSMLTYDSKKNEPLLTSS